MSVKLNLLNKMNDTRQDSEPKSDLLAIDILSRLPDWAYYLHCLFLDYSKDVIDYLQVVVMVIFNLAVLYIIVGVVGYVVLSSHRPDQPRKRVMFITAHPDDEVMFFGPTIIKLRETCDIYLLCLSTGNMYGRERDRKKELWASGEILGIPASNIILFSHPAFPDDPQAVWSAKKAYELFYFYIEAYDIEEVYTFDIEGVSGHLNHISIFYGFARMCIKNRVPLYCRVFMLDTVNKIRKYSAFFDASTSFCPITERIFMTSWNETAILRKAMRAHKSQMVWFRTLYIYFSRYMYINTYKELTYDDVQLVLQMNEFNDQ